MPRKIQDYEVFKLAHSLVLQIYQVTKTFPPEERFGLASQMRRSAYSIPMNLVEGSARSGEMEFKHFVNIAFGSCAEIKYQLRLSKDLRYIEESEYKKLFEGYDQIGKMLYSLMNKLKVVS